MRVLLTGATGYIGKRLLPVLLDQGHEVICCVRDKHRFLQGTGVQDDRVSVFELDLLKPLPDNGPIRHIDAAYYLVHSMSASTSDFDKLERRSAEQFLQLLKGTEVKQVIYLGGITNKDTLSRHLASRQQVEQVLRSGPTPVTSLKAGIIVGSGSASFEIIRDLVEKLPVMITPKWLNTRTQPVAIRNVLQYLSGVMMNEHTFGNAYDIGGPSILTYKEMLLQFGEVRGLKRYILTVPVMTPKLSSYWLYFVTATSYKLAVNLVDSMKIEVIAAPNDLNELLGIQPMAYKEAVKHAFLRIDQNNVVSSWKDALISSDADGNLTQHLQVPSHGCFVDDRNTRIDSSPDEVMNRIWRIGGDQGWYYGNWLWKIRGYMDKLFGGVGLRRGRRSPTEISAGDAIDFWRVLVADRKQGRLLLYAEMQLPGEAWLEFKTIRKNGAYHLQQTATFRPKGLLGRLYWYAVLPFHFFVFDGMMKNIAFSQTK